MKSELGRGGRRIPRDGTISAAVYRLTNERHTPTEIAKILDTTPVAVRVLLWRIRHPKKANEMSRAYWVGRKKREKDGRELASIDIRAVPDDGSKVG